MSHAADEKTMVKRRRLVLLNAKQKEPPPLQRNLQIISAKERLKNLP